MLQESVDALIDNGRRGRPVTGPNNRTLKSLSEMLKGKQGRFRQNLLGKRVDYSGRSVIVVGPELKMYQCGLPKEMALELFKPFVMKRLTETGKAQNVKCARKMVERGEAPVWDALETVIKGHPVMLNRAPTLHRLGIQAFEPVLVEGRAIKLHPLVCTAFNADFDGDQMAVHVPLSSEAQAEARLLMLASGNLLKPSDGKPVAVPTQDMVLGSYYLTLDKDGEPGEGKYFKDFNEALLAYDAKVITLHSKIKVRRTGEFNGKPISKMIDTTVGKIIFNRPIPQDLGFTDRNDEDKCLGLEIDFLVGKKQLGQIIERCIKVHGVAKTSVVLDEIKAQGYKYSTKGALTVAVCDATIPPQKKEIIANTEREVDTVLKLFRKGLLTDEERYNLTIKAWERATTDVANALSSNMDRYNPIQMMAHSGARGSANQIKQLAGMRGLIANTSGRTIEIPILSNYREGLNILEYFISSRGARKGLADTALRTADSGYLTRRLVDVSQEVIIRDDDCGCEHGIEVYAIKDGNEVIESLEERLYGRYLVNDFATGKVVTKGEAVGIIAAQSIGEPGTQLTMRTFHTGGIASAEDITQGLPRVEELFEGRKPKALAIISEIDGIVSLEEDRTKSVVKNNVVVTNTETGEKRTYLIPFGSRRKVQEGDFINAGDRITDGSVNPHDILAIKGSNAVQEYLIEEVQRVYRLQGVDINDKHIEVIVRQMMKKVQVEDPGDTLLLPNVLVDRAEFEAANEEIMARREQEGDESIRLATCRPVMQGITKASLSTESFLSAASFQETTKVLTDAAIKGKIDPLVGLKENVIIGKLVPAGTGMVAATDRVVELDPISSMDV